MARTDLFMFSILAGILVQVTVGLQSHIANYATAFTLPCPLDGARFPQWTGPETLNNPLTTLGNQVVSEEGFTIVNEKDLKIDMVVPKHDGIYTCSDGINSENVKLEVYYNTGGYRASAEQTANELGYMDITCIVKSYPDTEIRWENVEPRFEITGTTCTKRTPPTEFDFPNICQSNVRIHNVTKGDNGRPVTCTFIYSDGVTTTTKDISAKMSFEFAPTKVNVTKTKLEVSGRTLYKLTCTSDSAYPESVLQWRKKSGEVMKLGAKIGYTPDVFNGFNATLEVEVDSTTEKEVFECCATHKRLEAPLCKSIGLHTTGSGERSGAVSIATHVLVLIPFLLITLML